MSHTRLAIGDCKLNWKSSSLTRTDFLISGGQYIYTSKALRAVLQFSPHIALTSDNTQRHHLAIPSRSLDEAAYLAPCVDLCSSKDCSQHRIEKSPVGNKVILLHSLTQILPGPTSERQQRPMKAPGSSILYLFLLLVACQDFSRGDATHTSTHSAYRVRDSSKYRNCQTPAW